MLHTRYNPEHRTRHSSHCGQECLVFIGVESFVYPLYVVAPSSAFIIRSLFRVQRIRQTNIPPVQRVIHGQTRPLGIKIQRPAVPYVGQVFVFVLPFVQRHVQPFGNQGIYQPAQGFVSFFCQPLQTSLAPSGYQQFNAFRGRFSIRAVHGSLSFHGRCAIVPPFPLR